VEDIRKQGNELYLYRSLINDSNYPSQSFSRYLVSLEFNVDSFLSSKYIANKDVLLCITNDNRKEFENMKMSDVIPSNVYKFAALSVVYSEGNLYIHRGYLPWEATVNLLPIPLGGRPLKEISNLYIIIQCSREMTRIIAGADDMIFGVDLDNINSSESISTKSLVYNHPSLNSVKLNLHNPKIEVDYKENIKQHLSRSEPGSNKLCGLVESNCDTCANLDNSINFYCISCYPGFVFFRNQCLPIITRIENSEIRQIELKNNKYP
jgi:hypothetical protein